ncbi:hypothetical protein PM082_020827 [Marasmius tenuissimus]|nr:hypothetical protein PM082_020827 [Marasmius tenuissimus]
MEYQPRRKGKEKAPSSPSVDNPFISQYRPPPGETEEERIRRARAAQDAQRVSKEIDESLLETKKYLDRRRRGLRLLLLGACRVDLNLSRSLAQMLYFLGQAEAGKVNG